MNKLEEPHITITDLTGVVIILLLLLNLAMNGINLYLICKILGG